MRPTNRSVRRAAVVAAAVSALHCAAAPPPAHELQHALGVELGFDAEGGSALKLELAVPYSELVFERRHDGAFECRLRLAVLVLDTEGRQRAGEVWMERITASSAAETRSATRAFEGRFTLSLPPGRQRVVTTVEVVGTQRRHVRERWIDAPEVSPGALRLGEVQFWQHRPGAPGDGWVPNPSRTYRRGSGDPHVRCEVQDPLAPAVPVRYDVAYRVVDDTGEVVLHDSLLVESSGPRFELRFDLHVQALVLGRHTFDVAVRRDGRRAETTASFDVGFAALTWAGDLDETLEMLSLVLPGAEVDSLRQAPPRVREARWRALWARCDPDPTTPENEFLDAVFERVRFANAHFAGRGAGWKSDRGRVYVRFGSPTTVDRLGDRLAGGAVERWTYTGTNRVFVFVDADGHGDYVLERSNEPRSP